MKSERERVFNPLLVGLSIIMIISFFTGNASGFAIMGGTQERDPSEEFSIEVLLNRDDITYDIELMDDYVDEGYFSYLEVGVPDLISEEYIPGEEEALLTEDPEEENKFPPGSYYMYGSHLVPEIAVVMTEIDDTRMIDVHFPGVDVDGLSISFVVPTKLETFDDPIQRSKSALPLPMELNYNVTNHMEERGYFVHPIFNDHMERVGLAMIDGPVSIMIFNGSSNDTLWSGISSGVAATVPEIYDTTTVDDDIRSLLSRMELNSSLWSGEYFNATQKDHRLIPDIETVIEEIDWNELVLTELHWLQDNGFVEGLDEEEVNDISSLSVLGVSGVNHRIIFDEDEWKTFDEIGQVPNLGSGWENTGMDSRYSLGKDPLPVPPDREPDQEFPFIIVIFAFVSFGVVLIIGSSFGYARHKRNELLNNLNRKHLFETISEKPGIHFSELQRELDLKQGVLSYHLNVLEKSEFIKSIQDGTYRKFYLFDDKIELEFKLHEMQEKILMVISQKPGITQSKISKRLGRNKMVINYHLKILLETGILHMEREGRETHCYIDDPNYVMAAA